MSVARDLKQVTIVNLPMGIHLTVLSYARDCSAAAACLYIYYSRLVSRLLL